MDFAKILRSCRTSQKNLKPYCLCHPCITLKSHNIEVTKPKIIDYYNNTKGGVDSLDKKCACYSASRRTRRWPMALFLQMLDVTTINAYILHQSYRNARKLERLHFLKRLAKVLVTPLMERRLQHKQIPRELKFTLERILNKTTVSDEIIVAEEECLETRRLCHICPSKLKRKTRYLCIICKKPICLQCSRNICLVCREKRNM